MTEKNTISKKVYRLLPMGFSYIIDKTKTYTISEVKPYEKAKDYCKHFVLTDTDGNEVEIREWECVFCPNYDLDEVSMINKYLSDNQLYADGVWHDGGDIMVQVNWGDWKHDHLWLRDLMQYLGYTHISEYVTEENRSDCYSAEHTFHKNN